MKKIKIEHVRGIKDKEIIISDDTRKHLILTGKNGSGKTSVLDAMASYLNQLSTIQNFSSDFDKFIQSAKNNVELLKKEMKSEYEIHEMERSIERWISEQKITTKGIELDLNMPKDDVYAKFSNNEFVLAYFDVDRRLRAPVPTSIEKVKLKEKYLINESPLSEFIKFLADLKMQDALAYRKGDTEKVEQIGTWLARFEDLLKEIFDTNDLTIAFDDENYNTIISVTGKEPFDFNTLSSGYGAVLNIVIDLILRMQHQTGMKFVFDMPGIVLIDEIETHLHIELQKSILGFLTTLFPNIQFVITTHSPFILNSIENVVIYDLEHNTLVKDGLVDVASA